MEMLLLVAVGCCFLLLPQVTAEAVRTGLQVCANAILPALFPFFVLTDYWIRRGHAHRLSRSAGPLMESLFHLPGNSASAFLLGSIGGYPVGARTVAQLYSEGCLSKNQAEQALYFCNNAGPAFVMGVMGGGLFQSTLAGAALYLIHLSSAVLTGVLFRPKKTSAIAQAERIAAEPAPQAFTQAISNGGKTAIQVCIFVLFFAILTGCIQAFLPNTPYTALLTGSLELAGGAKALGDSTLPVRMQFLFSAFLLGWGGLCVMMQSLSLLHSAGLSGKNLLLGKLCQAGFSLLLGAIIVPVLPLKQSCFLFPDFLLSAYSQLLLLPIIFLLGIFLKESTGKVENNRI